MTEYNKIRLKFWCDVFVAAYSIREHRYPDGHNDPIRVAAVEADDALEQLDGSWGDSGLTGDGEGGV